MPSCYRSGYEYGPWYELKSLRLVIDDKRSRGDTAKFEMDLYKSWLKKPEYKKADEENMRKGIYINIITSGTSKSGRLSGKKVVNHSWRRKKEKQLSMAI